jgi:hypothetical protein
MQDARSRSAIQTTQLCKRLNAFALGLADPAGGNGHNPKGPFEMTDTQVRAALGLLRKTLPDLSSTDLTAQIGGNIFLLHLEAARATSQQLIEGKVEPAPQDETNLLDQSLPTE